MDMNPYAFNTLWQELTNSCANIGNSIIQLTEVENKRKELEDFNRTQTTQKTRDLIAGQQKGNGVFYTISGVLVIALVGLFIYLIIKKNK